MLAMEATEVMKNTLNTPVDMTMAHTRIIWWWWWRYAEKVQKLFKYDCTHNILLIKLPFPILNHLFFNCSSTSVAKKKFYLINGTLIRLVASSHRFCWLLLWPLFTKDWNTIENTCSGKHTTAYNIELSHFQTRLPLWEPTAKIQLEWSKFLFS